MTCSSLWELVSVLVSSWKSTLSGKAERWAGWTRRASRGRSSTGRWSGGCSLRYLSEESRPRSVESERLPAKYLSGSATDLWLFCILCFCLPRKYHQFDQKGSQGHGPCRMRDFLCRCSFFFSRSRASHKSQPWSSLWTRSVWTCYLAPLLLMNVMYLLMY